MRAHRRNPASLLTLLLASIVAGCSSSSGADASTPESTSPAAPPPPTAAASPEATLQGAPRPAPTTAEGCRDLVTDIVNDPPMDGGVAMSNATTAGDAGASDRLVPVMEVIQKNRDAFRCCFDLWGREHAGEEANVALMLELDPAGALKKASFKADETTLKAPEVETCMSDVAAKASFPPSPSGKETTYTHRFIFKARAR